MSGPRPTASKRGMARLAVAVVAAALLGPACTGGGLDDARKGRKEIQRIDPAAAETELVAGANTLRREQGLPPLAVDPNLTDKARRWSATMAGEGRLYHSPLADGVVVPWSRLGENVGQGMAARSVHESFVASPRHHANLSDPAFTHIGVGVAPTAGGALYVTEVFMEAGSPAPPRAAVPAPTSPARPRPAPPPEARRATTRPPPAPPPPAGPPPAARTPSAQLIHVLRQLRELEGP